MSRPCLHSIMKLLGHFLDDPPTSPPSRHARQATMTAQSVGYKTSPSAASLAASPSVFTFTVTSKPRAERMFRPDQEMMCQ